MAGDGYILVGDAFAFIDPVFSSGVMLAMSSAPWGPRRSMSCSTTRPRRGGRSAASSRVCGRRSTAFSWLIYRINTPVLRDMFMEPRNRFRMRDGLVSLLAGNVHAGRTHWRPFSPSRAPITASSRLPAGLPAARTGWSSCRRTVATAPAG